MKRGKEDEKPMSPMFPRLHVNEREKGGPRAPPRNKMALYEQLSIPSQRFNSGMSSYNNNSSATSSSQVSGNKRPLFSPLQLPRSTPQADTANASSSDFRPSFSAPRKRVDEEDFAVPVFVEPENGQNSKHSDTVDRNFLSLSRPPQINTPSRNQTTCLNSPSPPEDHESRDVDELQSSNEGLNHEVIDGPQLENMQNISSNGEHYKEKTKYSPGIQNGNRCDDDSDTSMVDSASGVCITPDEVVGVIGQKHFWKARRAIVNQQRVFAVQVFELHRLIKVQKSFAGSPNLLHEDTTSVRKTLNTSIPKQISLEFIIKPPAKIDNLKEDYLNNSPNSENKEGSADNTVPRSSISNQIQFPSSNAQAPPVTSDPSANPWYVNQPTGQQWLVPVMSPTEGLIYKPYAGPDHTGSNPMMSNFSYPTYGSPYSYPQGVPNIYQFFQGMGIPPNYPSMTHHGYFPSYGMPYMGPTISGSVVNQQQQNSYSGQTQQMNNNSTPNVENSARTMMGSTVSSPPEESNNGNSMLLPNNQGDGVANENLTRAIKVVPHNAVSANETAFRIFQSIQKEREEQNEESA